ncbi:MAG: iron ABC transporter permease [Gemmatimonadota bacterium]|nr:iron ABC transporter permease [Gemmatimonadota bacterium]
MSAIRGSGGLGGLLALAVVALVALGVALRYGAVAIPLAELASAVTGEARGSVSTIVLDLRLPRVVLGALVGGSLALAGATFQALLRNPLAEPYVLGVSSGAAVGAVAAIAAGWAAAAAWTLPAAAFVGAMGAILLVLRIGTRAGGGLDVRVLLLAGVVAGTFFNACILLLLAFQEADAFRAALFWMMGSLSGAGWGSVAMLAGAAGVSLVVLVGLARSFDLIAIGEETAVHLGARVERVRITAYLIASLLTAAAVVTAGGIGFVGLVVPHAVRMTWGGDHRFLLPASFLAGAAFLPLADLFARVVVAPGELPLGVVTAFVGVPFFVWLLRRRTAEVAA